VVRLPSTDHDGWVYGSTFDRLCNPRPGGRASKRVNDHVRSRVWRRLDAEMVRSGQQQHACVRTAWQQARPWLVRGTALASS
jgi:hypothetical protein